MHCRVFWRVNRHVGGHSLFYRTTLQIWLLSEDRRSYREINKTVRHRNRSGAEVHRILE